MTIKKVIVVSVDLIRVHEKFSDFLKERRFKKGRVRLIVGRFSTELERCEVIVEGMWDTWVNSPPGMFLKDVETYDRVKPAERGYTVKALTPKYSKKTERRNVQKKGGMFVSAHSILFIELCE